MSAPSHDRFTLLYEDVDTRVLYECNGIIADEVISHIISFLKGCGYCESSIYEVMQEKAEMYFEAQQPLKLPIQQDDLIGLD
jgi:hypothetical protein